MRYQKFKFNHVMSKKNLKKEFIILNRHKQNKKAKAPNEYALEPGKTFLYKTCFSI